MTDLTILFVTKNETPPKWAKFHMEYFLRAANDYPIISISRQPMDLGINLIDTDKPDYANIYRQMLRGAKIADTEFVAMAEDDTLYSNEHFREFRPKEDEFAYNRAKWSLFSWQPVYSIRPRISNCGLIAPRKLLIEALQERFDKYPNNDYPMEYMGECGRRGLEAGLGITQRNAVEFYSSTPIIQLSHPKGTEYRQQIKRKKHGLIRAYDIPFWRKAEDIIKNYG
jgi:hypothetical protein